MKPRNASCDRPEGMKVHFELGCASPRAARPTGPATPLGEAGRSALFLAEELVKRGWQVSVRGSERSGLHAGVDHLPPWHSPTASVIVCVAAPPPLDTPRARHVAWSASAHLSNPGEWASVVVGNEYDHCVLRGRYPVLELIRSPVLLPRAGERRRDRFLHVAPSTLTLHRLLAMWPVLWKAFGLPLSIAGEVSDPPPGEDLGHLLDQPGILAHRVGDDAARAELYARSVALLHPLEGLHPRRDALVSSIMDACAAGCPPVLAPIECLPGEFSAVAAFVEGYEGEAWLAAIRRTREDWASCSRRAQDHAQLRSVDAWLADWEALLLRPAAIVRAPRRQSWALITHGIGYGETAHARLLAESAVAAGHDVRAIVRNPLHAFVFADLCPVEAVPGAADALLAGLAGTDRLVLASSFTCTDIIHTLAREPADIPIVCLETAWPIRIRDASGLDAVLTCQPEGVHAAGIRQGLLLSATTTERVWCVGPLPPPRARRSVPGRIVIYLSSPSDWVHTCTSLFAEVFGALAADGVEIRQTGGPGAPWVGEGVLRLPLLSHAAHAEELASGTVVISSGASTTTTALALASGVRVLAVTGRYAPGPKPSLGEMESAAYAEASSVVHLSLPVATEVFLETLRGLLRAPPPEPIGGGAGRAVSLIEHLVPRRDHPRWRPPLLRS